MSSMIMYDLNNGLSALEVGLFGVRVLRGIEIACVMD
jgi:hypothetical protein